jgi:hypothetical protein
MKRHVYLAMGAFLRDVVGGFHRHRDDAHLIRGRAFPSELKMAPRPIDRAEVVTAQYLCDSLAVERRSNHPVVTVTA